MLIHLDQIATLFLNGSSSLYLDGLAWTATQTATWLPLAAVLLYLVIRNNDLAGVCGIVLCIALSITLADQMASTVCKPLFARYRPANDQTLMYAVDVVNGYRGGAYGFFSSHAANTVAVATFVALLVRNRTLTYWLYSWAAVNCWTRAYLGVHYVGDLTVGCIWGGLVGWGVYKLWLRFMPRSQRQRMAFGSARPATFTATGYGLGSVHLFISAIAVTYIFIAFKAMFFS